MNQDEIIKLIKKEVQNSALEELVQQQRKKSLIDNLKHPLLSVALGFFLTGVIGTKLTRHFQEQENQKILQRAAFDNIRQFSKDFYARTTNAGYVHSNIVNNNIGNLAKNNMAQYKDSVKTWNINLIANNFIFREYLKTYEVTFIQKRLDDSVSNLLTLGDFCLTESINKKHSNDFSDIDFQERESLICWASDSEDKTFSIPFKKLMVHSRKCGYEVFNTMHNVVTIEKTSKDKKWRKMSNTMSEQILEVCRIPNEIRDYAKPIPSHRISYPYGR